MCAPPVPAFSPPDLITAATVQEADLVGVEGTIVPGPVGWSDPWGNESQGFWVTTMHPFGTEPFVRVLAEAPEGFQVVMAFGRVHWWNGRAVLADAEVRFWGHSYEWWLAHRYEEREGSSQQTVTPPPVPRQPGFGILTEPQSVTIPEAKLSPDGSWVQLDAQIVSAAFTGFFYIESDHRECGLRVDRTNHGVTDGLRANVGGTMATNGSGERYIGATDPVYPNGTGSVAPLSLNNRCVGGGDWFYDPGPPVSGQMGVAGSLEMNNIGLLVRAWGQVTYRDASCQFFYIDDGAALDDGVGTGISSTERINGLVQRKLLVREQDDITAPGDDWPMFLHDPQHQGRSWCTDADAGESFTLEWSAPIDTAKTTRPIQSGWSSHPNPAASIYSLEDTVIFPHPFFDSSPVHRSGGPIVVGGWVDTGNDPNQTYFDSEGYVAAFRPTVAGQGQNQMLWRYPSDPQSFLTGGVASTPCIARVGDEDRVFFGCANGRVYCLALSTGELRWSYLTTERAEDPNNEPAGKVLGPPVVYDGILYVGNESGPLYALAASDGALKWRFDASNVPRSGESGSRNMTGMSSPAVAEVNGQTRVFVGCDNGYLYDVRGSDGVQMHQWDLIGCVESSPM